MSFKANAIKKFRKWLRNREQLKMTAANGGVKARDGLNEQVSKLLESRGNEIITMTTL